MTFLSLLNKDPLKQRIDLISIARDGIKTKYLKPIQEYTSLDDKELSAILPISQRQLLRYKATHNLNKEITSHLILIVELFEKGYALFGEEKFRLWIRTPNKTLNKHRPIDLLDTALGIEMIRDIIGRIKHGVYS